jgi:hypothetical protein
MEVKLRIVEVDPLGFMDTYRRARSMILDRLSRGYKVSVCISAGMRAPTVALVLAAATLPQDVDPSNVQLQGDIESGEGYVVVSMEEVMAAGRLRSLEEQALSIVSERGYATSSMIARELNVSRPTAWRILKKLEGLGLLEMRKRRWYPRDVRGLPR